MWNPFPRWRKRRLLLTEDEWLALLQRELEKRGIYGSSNAQSTKDPHVKTIVYVWPDDPTRH